MFVWEAGPTTHGCCKEDGLSLYLSSPVLTKLFFVFHIAKLFPHSFCCLLMIITLLMEEMYQVNLLVYQKVR